ncbi:MAG: hypothetical protein JWO53_953 [Chlamydiia bacterium]|nr:hypothetical protein [Chlamydiia bacterium]
MTKPVEFAVVVPSYNNASWACKNLASIAEQTYPHFHLYYIDDASTDNTRELAELFLQQPGLKERHTLICNAERQGSLANFYRVIHQIEPHKVIVCVDGDDWLAHPKVLERVALEYSESCVWLTYGSYESEPPGLQHVKPISADVYRDVSFRSYDWVTDHLKTFYAKLFQLIEKEDLLFQGHFFPMAGDVAFMLPMLEMAAKGHIRMIPETLYIYNICNPLNDWAINRDAQTFLELVIREKERYTSLQTLFPE